MSLAFGTAVEDGVVFPITSLSVRPRSVEGARRARVAVPRLPPGLTSRSPEVGWCGRCEGAKVALPPPQKEAAEMKYTSPFELKITIMPKCLYGPLHPGPLLPPLSTPVVMMSKQVIMRSARLAIGIMTTFEHSLAWLC